MYVSEKLPRWEHPSSYAGHSPDGDYMICGQSRDSDALERSNYERIFQDLVKKARELGQPEGLETDYHDDPKQYVYDWRAHHWAVGWVEQVILKASAPEELIKMAEEIRDALDGYPVYDESHFSELEWTECEEYWNRCSVKERIEIIKESGSSASIFAARRDYSGIEDDNGSIHDWLRD